MAYFIREQAQAKQTAIPRLKLCSQAMRKTSRTTYLIAFIFFLVGLTCLLVSGLRAGGAYFVTVSEALAMHGDAPVNMKLFGVVSTMNAAEDATGRPVLDFALVDLADLNAQDRPGQTIAARFVGDAPPLFKSGAEVIAQGTYDPRGRTFTATELITKCPAKYEKQNRQVSP